MTIILVDDELGLSVKLKDIIVRYDKKYKFIDIFRQRDGFTITSNVIKDEVNKNAIAAILKNLNGISFVALIKRITECDKEIFTDHDAFMRSMPALLDIGIMGTPCVSRNTCQAACYQGRGHRTGKDMDFEDYKSLINQIKGSTMQVALGGSGNPDEYQHFEELLRYTRDNDIIPNYTTSGHTFNKHKAELTKEFCGACAVSWAHPKEYRDKAINLLIEEGVTTNIHYVLSKSTIVEAIHRLKNLTFDYPNSGFPDGINAVIFLLFKPVGCGDSSEVLDVNDPNVKEFYELVDNWKGSYKIGFDSCACSGVVNFCKNIDTMSFDACESGRMSVYVTPDMYLLPCSFDNQHYNYAVSLKENTIAQAWHSELFDKFRSSFTNSCPSCSIRSLCLGSCPLERSIVLCNREEKIYI